MTPRPTVIESPFAGSTPDEHRRNIYFARLCLKDSLLHGEAPFASHLLYPQVLEDLKVDERALGIRCNIEWIRVARRIAVYTALGVSPGMHEGCAAALAIFKQDTADYRIMYRPHFRAELELDMERASSVNGWKYR